MTARVSRFPVPTDGPETRRSLFRPGTGKRWTSSANIRSLGVSGDYLLLTTNDPVTESVNITTGATWTPQSTTTGTTPGLAADGTAVYWTHEGALMRLCE